ncbi:MAG: hypothetical protein ACJASM_002034 [Salibacteraceae bacterium]|jgi:hypothetical protein
MEELKQTLDNLGFETLPTLNEFRKRISGTILGSWSYEMYMNGYGDFIDQPFTLSQLVPCKDGVPMEEPKKEDFHLEVTREQGGENEVTTEFREDYFNEAIEEYQKAVDAVIFEMNEDFEINESHTELYYSPIDFYLNLVNGIQTIESFINNGGKLKLK